MNTALNGTRRALRLGTGLATCISGIMLAHSAMGQSLPELANAGGASISTTGTTLKVDALDASRVIDWNTFSVASGNTVSFVSTNGGTTATNPVTVVNRVIGADVLGTTTYNPSYINGILNASNSGNNNIAIWLINPAGITFGPSGAFSGGSLVLSQLDFPDGGGLGTNTRLTKRTVVTAPTLDVDGVPLNALELKLVAGPGAINASANPGIANSGTIALIGERITVGKTVNAADNAYIVAASDVRLTTNLGSPIGYQINAGTTLEGAQVLATGDVKGRNIVLATFSAASAINTLLKVDAGGKLTATAVDGGIELTTTSATAATGGPAVDIVSEGTLRTLGTSGDITVKSNASASVAAAFATGNVTMTTGAGATDSLTAGAVSAGENIDLRATGDLVVGTADAQRIVANGSVKLTSTGGKITEGATGISIVSDNDISGAEALTVKAPGDIDLGTASLSGGNLGKSAAVSIESTAGAVSVRSAHGLSFRGVANTTFDSDGAISAGVDGAPAGVALLISAPGDVTLNSVRTFGTDQDLTIQTNGVVDGGAIFSSADLTISQLGNRASSILVDDLRAAGTIGAHADGLVELGNAESGATLSLRTDGDVYVGALDPTGTIKAGTDLRISGATGAAVNSFAAGNATATSGFIGVNAKTIDVGVVRSGTSTSLSSTGAAAGTGTIAVGGAIVGTDLTITTPDNIVLGKTGQQTIAADGKITITSTGGAISRGAGTALTIRSNSDDSGADLLSITADGDVALGNATLNGGSDASAAVAVRSTNGAITMGGSRATRFTANAGTSFTSSAAIVADNTPVDSTAIAITAPGAITLTTAAANGTNQDVNLQTRGPVVADAVSASRNLTISAANAAATSVTANRLTALDGSLTVYANAIGVTTISAGQAVALRSDGAIDLGTVSAGTDFTVDRLGTVNPTRLTTTGLSSAGGLINVRADSIDLAATRSGTSTTLTGTQAVKLGSAFAGTNLTVSTPGQITLGKTGSQTIAANGTVSITSTAAGIDRGAGSTALTIRSNDDDTGADALALSASTSALLGNAVLSGGDTGTAAVTVRATTGDVTMGSSRAAKFTGTAGNGFAASGAIVADNSAVAAGDAIAITAGAGGIALTTAQGNGATQDVTLTTTGAITASTITAGRNLTIASAATPAASLTATKLSALAGAINASAGAMTIGSADAASALTLRSNGAIAIGTSLKAGTDVTIAGTTTGGAAASFTAPTVMATAGTIAVTAATTDIGNATSGLDTRVTGTDATLGAVTAGRDYIVNATGTVVLGKAANQTQRAVGAVTISGNQIREGAAGLTITANSDGAGTGPATLTATGDIALANATINGGPARQSDVLLTSTGSTAVKTVNAANITASAGGAIAITTATAATNVTVKGIGAGSAASFTATNVTATSGAIDVKAGATSIASATSGANTSVTGATATIGSVTAGGNYAIAATGDVTLGAAANQTQRAAGTITIAGRNIAEGAAGLTLTANSDSAGAGPATLTASGTIALANATINGGPARQSDVSLTSTGDTTVKAVNAANIAANAGGAVTLTTASAANNVTVKGLGAGSATAFTANAVTATAGTIDVKAGTTSITSATSGLDTLVTGTSATFGTVNSGRDITVTASGAVTAGSLTAARDVKVAGPGAAEAASFTASTVTATAGAIDVKAGATDIATAKSGTDTTITGTSAVLGSVAAGGNYTVTTTGDVTLGKAANQTQAAGGVLSITSTGGSISQGATGLTLVANSDGTGAEPLTLAANGAIALGNAALRGGPAQQSKVSTTSGGDTTLGSVSSADFTANAGGAIRSGTITAAGNASITAGAAVTLTSVTASGAGHDVTITTPGAITATTIDAARNVTVKGAGTANAGALTAMSVTAGTGAVDVKAGATDIVSASAGTDVRIAGTTAAVGKVVAGGNYTIDATGDVRLGKAGNATQSAAGAVAIKSATGSISQSVVGVVLTANSDGKGAETLELTAGKAIALGDAALNGGTAQQSAIVLKSGTDTSINKASAAAFTADASGAFTAADPILAAGNASITAVGNVTLDTVIASGTGNDITITAGKDVRAGTLTAARNVTVGGAGGTSAASLSATNVTATAGAVTVRAGDATIVNTTSGTDTRLTVGKATLSNVTAGGAYTIEAKGDVILGTAAGRTQSAAGAITVKSTEGSISEGSSGLVLTSNSDGKGGDALTLEASKGSIALGSATLNGGTARSAAITLTSGGATSVGTANASNLAVTAGTTFTLERGAEVVDKVSLTARDAIINGVAKAKTIDVRNTATGKLVIGGTATGTSSNFVLNAAEISRLQASETLNLGVDAAHDVELLAVRFTAPKQVNILAVGKRIDVNGLVSADGSTALRIGGNAAGTGRASLIQIASDKTGSIQNAGGVLELRAEDILAGDAALIAELEKTAAGSARVEAARILNLQANSVLYNGKMNNAVLVQADSLKIDFSGYALFQNTGTSLLGTGVSLGSAGGSGVKLNLANTSTSPVFAMFGSINGVQNNATALLGNPPLARYDAVNSSRVNGCVIGGGNCQSVQNLTPALSALENIRNSIFTVKPDFQVPFDPLVGTNNDALFDDVGSFGLGDVPMTPIECSEPNGRCDVNKKDGM